MGNLHGEKHGWTDEQCGEQYAVMVYRNESCLGDQLVSTICIILHHLPKKDDTQDFDVNQDENAACWLGLDKWVG